MRTYIYSICIFLVMGVAFYSLDSVYGQTLQNDPTEIQKFPIHENYLPLGAEKKIELLDFKNADLRDVVRAIASKYNLNIFIEDDINNRITIHLGEIPVYQALKFIARQYGLALERDGNIFKFKRPPIPKPEPKPLAIVYEDRLLGLNLKNADLQKVVEEISKKSGQNVLVNQGVHGHISGFLQRIPFDQGLKILMNVNGFSVRENNGIFLIDRNYQQHDQNDSPQPGKHFWISIKDSLVTLDVTKANIRDVLREIFLQIGLDVVMYEEVKGEISARCSNIAMENVLGYLLKGTNFTYLQENGVYLIGGKSLQGINRTQLIRLKHLRADKVIELLPQSITKNASIKIIKEHNGFVVTGSQELINEAESFIQEIDHPTPQILIEAMVVDFTRQHIGEFGIKAGIGAPADSSHPRFNSLFPVIDIAVSGSELNSILDTYGGGIGLSRIAKLPDNFYLQIKALESEGKANVRSRPQIATLNGHTASISIGTTQYFILKTETPISGTNQVVLQESERFETIKAEMILKVTPWVTENGEIITEIHPEFSTPKNGLNPSVPPTIDHRVLDSVVKLKDGETIILGGLIQEFDTETITKFPLLGHIPLLGKLFQSRSYNKSSAELIIYLTPHVYYVGDEINTFQGVIQ